MRESKIAKSPAAQRAKLHGRLKRDRAQVGARGTNTDRTLAGGPISQPADGGVSDVHRLLGMSRGSSPVWEEGQEG